MISIKGLEKTFNQGTINEKKVLDGFDLEVSDGDFITVIGSNGAGKSTLLNCISGSVMPDQGSILLGGKDITFMSESKRAAMIGRVFQDPIMGTAADMWIEENLALAYRRAKPKTLSWAMPRGEEKEFFARQLARLGLGLEDRMQTKVGLLSGGQRQALTLLMATIRRPELLLLDEHTAALDPRTAETVLKLSDEIIRSDGLTALMVTHNMQNAIDHGNRLIMMHAGKIILDIRGEDKKHLTVPDLLSEFAGLGGMISDEAVLSAPARG